MPGIHRSCFSSHVHRELLFQRCLLLRTFLRYRHLWSLVYSYFFSHIVEVIAGVIDQILRRRTRCLPAGRCQTGRPASGLLNALMRSYPPSLSLQEPHVLANAIERNNDPKNVQQDDSRPQLINCCSLAFACNKKGKCVVGFDLHVCAGEIY